MDGTAENFVSRITISVLERTIHIQESALLQGGDGEGNWAGAKYLLEFLFGDLPISLRLRQGGFGLLEIGKTFFQFFTVDLSGLVKPGILDGGGGGNGQQLNPPEMFLRIAVRLGVAGRKKSQELPGRNQRGAQPRAKLLVSLERLPSFFLVRVGDQYALLFGRYLLKERRLISEEIQRRFIGFVCGFGTELFTERQPMWSTFRNQNPRARVRNYLGQGPQKRDHDEVHSQVLGKRERCLPECVSLRPCRFGLGEVSDNLVLRLLLSGDFLRSPYAAENVPGVVADRKAMHFNPPHLTVSTKDAK